MDARLFFENARSASLRLQQVERLLGNDGEDWRPPSGRSAQISDPTMSRALAHIRSIEALLEEREALVAVLIDAQSVSRGIGMALGGVYGSVLDGYYIEAKSWHVVARELSMSRRKCIELRDTALDWLDSVGFARARQGEGMAQG